MKCFKTLLVRIGLEAVWTRKSLPAKYVVGLQMVGVNDVSELPVKPNSRSSRAHLAFNWCGLGEQKESAHSLP